MIYIGIDPGLSGAIAALDSHGMLIDAFMTPIIQPTGKGKTAYDVPNMVAVFDRWGSGSSVVAIEQVSAMPHDGVVSSFRFGLGVGIWQGIIAARGLTRLDIRPQEWQTELLDGLPRGKQCKASAVLRAKTLWPGIPIKLKKEWGIADAALIAETARRKHWRTQ